MATCNAKRSTASLRSGAWEGSERDRKYEGACAWKRVPNLSGTPFRSQDLVRLFPPPPQEQSYEGEFFRDSAHGRGTYKWDDLAVFEGSFYSNCKEGYATVSFCNNCYFEGLFVRNKAFGPGIFTYANGRQDAGFWMGRKLVRLSRAADYIIPRLAPTSVAKIKLLQFRRLIPLDDQRNSAHDILEENRCLAEHPSTPFSSLIYDPRSIFFDSRAFERTFFVKVARFSQEFQSTPRSSERKEGGEEPQEPQEPADLGSPYPARCLCPQDVFEMQYKAPDEADVCDAGSSADSQTGILYNLTKYGTTERPPNGEGEEEKASRGGGDGAEEGTEQSEAPKIVSWNRSDLCTEMLKQIFRYRAFEDRLNFSLAKLMIGARTAFRRTGVREKECLHFLKMCSLGPPHAVKDLLCSYEISEELMDARGNNSVMFAAATDQVEVIDILLDYGVDVNAFNDEGLTPLNLCLLRRLAYTNRISNWEAAFLPKEVDETLVPEGYDQNEVWESRQSIPSLDRVFGDGMSMNDSKTIVFDNRFLSPMTSPSLTKDHSEKTTARAVRPAADDSKESSTLSQVTVLNILRSARSLMNHSLEDLTQVLPSNGSQVLSAHSRPLASNEPTPKVDLKIIPKSNKRDEFERSVMKTSSDRYLFEFAFEKSPPAPVAGSRRREDSAKSAKGKPKREEPAAVEVAEPGPEPDLLEKIEVIDRTIEKLLKRGADPNVSEVPKPSVHLGVYTKDVATVRLLLMYGASPDSQLYPNEGLLTPLHVIVLLKPAAEFVQICELLLNFGANPEEETRPDFCICEEERGFLDSEQGRTPLQLLCMRPDAEYADRDGSLMRVALMLAHASNKRHRYKGHSCLTLAMHCGNLKLLRGLLQARYFDPNDLLGRDLGTALHVLVSTELQKKTVYETSIKICDLLLGAGADPTKKLKSPKKLVGNCVDYGYREVEEEKEARKTSTSGKREPGKGEKGGKEKGGARDHLKDHVRVVEYLKEVVRRSRAGESEREPKSLKEVQGSPKRSSNARKSSEDARRAEQARASGRGASVAKEKEGSRSEERKGRKGGSAEGGNEGRSAGRKGEGGEAEEWGEGKRGRREREQGERRGRQRGGDGEGEGEGRRGGERGREKVSKQGKESKERGAKEVGAGKTESNLMREKAKTSTKSVSVKVCSETFPEKVRQNLLKMFGTCINIDVNELLLPYVVLRDGELYYRFQGRGTGQKEQYSLI